MRNKHILNGADLEILKVWRTKIEKRPKAYFSFAFCFTFKRVSALVTCKITHVLCICILQTTIPRGSKFPHPGDPNSPTRGSEFYHLGDPNSTTNRIRILPPSGPEFYHPEDPFPSTQWNRIPPPRGFEFYHPEDPNSTTQRIRILAPSDSEFHHPEDPNSTNKRIRILAPSGSKFNSTTQGIRIRFTDLSGSVNNKIIKLAILSHIHWEI